MKKFLSFFILIFVLVLPVYSAVDKTSEDYLKNRKHLFSMNFVAETAVKSAIKKALKKEASGRYKVKFKSYTITSLKKGVFKYLEIQGRNVVLNGIELPYTNLKSVTDYNWIDYNQSPIVFKSDMTFAYTIHMSEKSVNNALETEEYKNILRRINKRAYPMFSLSNVKVKIESNKLRIIMSYNLPLAPRETDRTFVVTSGLKIVNNEILPRELAYDKTYGNIPLKKVYNLINLLNPLSFTMKLVENKKSDVKIDKISIEDDIIIINGKIYVKGED